MNESPDWAGLPLPLATVKVSVEVPPTPMLDGLNDLVRVVPTTVNVLDTAEVTRPPVTTLMLLDVFAKVPGVALVTPMVIVQLETPAVRLPLDSVMALAVKEIAPPHCGDDGAPAMTAPGGSVSVKPKPVCAGLPAELLMVKVSVLG